MKLNFACKSCRRRGISRERHAWSLAIGQRGVIIKWGVTAGKANQNASNARGVPVGKMGRNSSIYNRTWMSFRCYTHRPSRSDRDGNHIFGIVQQRLRRQQDITHAFATGEF